MNIGNNADEINQELPSIRRKYKKGRVGSSNINYGVVLKTTHKEISSKPIITEEHIIIKEEPKIIIEKVFSPIETSSNINLFSSFSAISVFNNCFSHYYFTRSFNRRNNFFYNYFWFFFYYNMFFCDYWL